MSRTSVQVAVAALAMAVAVAVPAPASAGSAPDEERYVAVGDSAAAAPGVPEQIDAPCARSSHNYPHLVAERLPAANFTDVTCTGASTPDLDRDQLNALTYGTTLVTVTIGGNDVGFAKIITKCSALGALNGNGAPCRASYATAGGDELDRRVANTEPKIAKALNSIHKRSPHARVLLVGYLNLIPGDHHGCRPRELFGAGDLDYLHAFENKLNAMFARVAAANGAVFVDNHPASAGHDICRAPGVRWSEALVPTSPAYPFHPNVLGERAMADGVLAAAGR